MREGTFHIITFGCQMNVHDSQWLEASLGRMGFSPAPVGEAELIILNTCSVRQKPEAKVMSALGRILQITNRNPAVCVAVCGCVAQQLGERLFEYSPQVRVVAGSDGLAFLPEALSGVLRSPGKKLTFLDFSKEYVERARERFGAASAYVSIMQGCDNFCSYCIVPFTRGRQKSRLKEIILEECRQRAQEGAVEITLLGQNVNAWGKDNGQGSFAGLLKDISRIAGIERLRYVTPHPRDMTGEDIAAFGEIPALCPRLHLPMQSGSDKVLASMRRGYDRKTYLRLVEELKKVRPDLALTTDIIVGFPGEKEEDFEQTLEMLEACSFITSFSFCYSDRPGARAALFPDKIPAAVSRERLLRFQKAQEKLSDIWLEQRTGQIAEVLVEGKSPRPADGVESWQGRDIYGALVHVIPNQPGDKTGRILHCRIEKAKRHSLVARELQTGG